MKKQLYGIALVSDLDGLSIKEYRKQLTDKINDLLVISTKPERSAKEQEIIKNNEDILNHLMDGTHIKTDAVIALVAHLEKERILGLIGKREELVKNRVIAELEEKKADPKYSQEIKRMVNTFVEKVSKEERERTQAFLEFAKDPDMAKITNEEKAKAKEENEAYKKQLSGKIVKKDKEVRAKTLMSIAAGLAVAAAVCATVATIVPVAAPILLPVIISLGISAAVTGFAAERMSPGVTKDLKNSFMHFRKKIKKHKMYAEKMKTIEEEVKATEVQAPRKIPIIRGDGMFGNGKLINLLSEDLIKHSDIVDVILKDLENSKANNYTQEYIANSESVINVAKNSN